jgi:predicted ATPase
MISSFSGKNYKAFDDFTIDIKPITILLGANSCGKSAIINALLMLSQTAASVGASESPLKLNGLLVGMGDSLNIIKNKCVDNELEFSITLNFDKYKELRKSLHMLRGKFAESHMLIARQMFRILQGMPEYSNPELDSIKGTFDYLYIPAENFESKELEQALNDSLTIAKIYKRNEARIKGNITKPTRMATFLEAVSLPRMKDNINALLSWSSSKTSPQKISYAFKYTKHDKGIAITKLKLFNRANEVVLSIEKNKTRVKLLSDVFKQSALDASKADIIREIDFDDFSLIANNESVVNPFIRPESNMYSTLIGKVIGITTRALITSLQNTNINHVSPLRAFPQRYYLLDKSAQHVKLNTLDGTELAEVIKKHPKIKEKINILFAPFNIAIDVEKVNDIIHKIVVNQDAVQVELTDVGFGISQVLPVLVQAHLSPKQSITIIEQPEIHLHPKMQAWLTDALISIAIDENKKFIIETHSEALIRRVRLRVVDPDNKITKDDVSIYHVEKDSQKGSSSKLTKVDMNDSGDITWPLGFMDVEINDTLLIQKIKFENFMKDKRAH